MDGCAQQWASFLVIDSFVIVIIGWRFGQLFTIDIGYNYIDYIIQDLLKECWEENIFSKSFGKLELQLGR